MLAMTQKIWMYNTRHIFGQMADIKQMVYNWWSASNTGSCNLLPYFFAVVKMISGAISLNQRRFKSQILQRAIKLWMRFQTLVIKCLIKNSIKASQMLWFLKTFKIGSTKITEQIDK